MSRRMDYANRVIHDVAFEGTLLDQIIEDARVKQLITDGLISERKAREKAKKAVGLYGHPEEKIEHVVDSLNQLGRFNEQFYGLETHAGGYAEVLPKLAKFYLSRAQLTNGYHEYYQRKHGDVRKNLRNIKKCIELYGEDYGNKNFIDFDVFGNKNLFDIFSEGFLEVCDKNGCVLVVSSMATSHYRALKVGSQERENFESSFGSVIPTHTEVLDFVVKYCRARDFSCEHVASRQMPNIERSDDARLSFFLKRK